MSEERLPGGFVNAVVRVADTVRRPPAPEFVHRLLRHFEASGWPGAPRYLGLDRQGREVLTFIPGHVAWDGQLRHSDAALVRVAELVREFHDLTAFDGEVVCHNDLSPKNTVYDAALMPIAFIDWDIAAPGRRIEDVAHACWQYIGLGPSIGDVAGAAGQIGVVADAYGGIARDALVETILWWQDRCWRGIAERADAGEPAMVRLRDLGTIEAVRTAYEWTAAHRETLAA